MKAATRYAKSLIDLSLEQGALETVYQDMLFIHDTCEKNRELIVFLNSPIIKTDKKIEVLHAVFNNLGKLSKSFVDLIARKRRENYLPEIAAEFISHYKKHKKILTAIVTTAVGLDDTLRKQVLDLVKQGNNNEVELVEKIDKNIIGGLILRVGDKQIDSSILRKIKSLTRTFSENPYIKEL